MNKLFREYRDSDYAQCEALVNKAWGFDKIFFPKALSDFAKCIYTQGAVLGSTYKMVIEVDGKIAGFIFGLNEYSKKPARNIIFGLKMLWRLIRIKSQKPITKHDLINAMKVHEQNRANIVAKGRSEIVLFVVAKEHQGKGYGKRLWLGFLDHCKTTGVTSIVVETNKLGASSFYQLLGFRHVGDFESPLHEFATKGGQACMFEYVCTQQSNESI